MFLFKSVMSINHITYAKFLAHFGKHYGHSRNISFLFHPYFLSSSFIIFFFPPSLSVSLFFFPPSFFLFCFSPFELYMNLFGISEDYASLVPLSIHSEEEKQEKGRSYTKIFFYQKKSNKMIALSRIRGSSRLSPGFHPPFRSGSCAPASGTQGHI